MPCIGRPNSRRFLLCGQSVGYATRPSFAQTAITDGGSFTVNRSTPGRLLDLRSFEQTTRIWPTARSACVFVLAPHKFLWSGAPDSNRESHLGRVRFNRVCTPVAIGTCPGELLRLRCDTPRNFADREIGVSSALAPPISFVWWRGPGFEPGSSVARGSNHACMHARGDRISSGRRSPQLYRHPEQNSGRIRRRRDRRAGLVNIAGLEPAT